MSETQPARERAAAALRREQTPQSRLDAADRRDVIANARDRAAQARDRIADGRHIAVNVDDAADQHALAIEDQRRAAQDREQAARERLFALVDRELLAYQLAIAETDPLTGARMRAAGLLDLDRELDRCRRTGGSLVVAYLDVVGLKTLNDAQGHGAGDDLLRGIVSLIRDSLRSYDLIVRLGGDEFLCAMSDTSLAEVRARFAAIAATLAAAPAGGAISTGFAELADGETAAQLIARADSELMHIRRANPDSRRALD